VIELRGFFFADAEPPPPFLLPPFFFLPPLADVSGCGEPRLKSGCPPLRQLKSPFDAFFAGALFALALFFADELFPFDPKTLLAQLPAFFPHDRQPPDFAGVLPLPPAVFFGVVEVFVFFEPKTLPAQLPAFLPHERQPPDFAGVLPPVVFFGVVDAFVFPFEPKTPPAQDRQPPD